MGDAGTGLLPVILVIGPPGIGKGTLCKALSSRLQLYHLSVGDLCRALSRGEEVRGLHECPQEIHDSLRTNNPTPGEVLLPLLREHLLAMTAEGKYKAVILDGFPRSLEQQQHFEQALPSPVLVVSLQCPTSIAQERYLGRNEAGRPGEDAELFELRTHKHLEQSACVEELYGKKGLLTQVDVSTGLDGYVDTVTGHIKQAIGLDL